MSTPNREVVREEYESLLRLNDEANQANGDRFSILLKVRRKVESTPWLMEIASDVFKTEIAEDPEKRPTGTALFLVHELGDLIEGINRKYEFDPI